MVDMFYFLDDPMAEIIEGKRILILAGRLPNEIPGQTYMFLHRRGWMASLMEGRWCRLSLESYYAY